MAVARGRAIDGSADAAAVIACAVTVTVIVASSTAALPAIVLIYLLDRIVLVRPRGAAGLRHQSHSRWWCQRVKAAEAEAEWSRDALPEIVKSRVVATRVCGVTATKCGVGRQKVEPRGVDTVVA